MAPQEYQRKINTSEDDIDNNCSEGNIDFFLRLETEIQNAKNTGKLICIQMDANSKFGRNVIKDDPNEKMSENGKFLYEIIQSENLVLVNSTDKCYGTITKYRKRRKQLKYQLLISLFCVENFMTCL